MSGHRRKTKLESAGKILMVPTPHDQLGNTGRKTGFSRDVLLRVADIRGCHKQWLTKERASLPSH